MKDMRWKLAIIQIRELLILWGQKMKVYDDDAHYYEIGMALL